MQITVWVNIEPLQKGEEHHKTLLLRRELSVSCSKHTVNGKGYYLQFQASPKAQ